MKFSQKENFKIVSNAPLKPDITVVRTQSPRVQFATVIFLLIAVKCESIAVSLK